MLLAELEVFHSRPIAPTRRVALGVAVLPMSPAPGFGGLLLAGVVAHFVADVDPDLLDDLERLTHQVEAGHRIPQPRLRHRFQADRVGLTPTRHRLIGVGEELRFDLHETASPAPCVLAAVYAAGRLPAEDRPAVFRAIRRGLGWRSGLGADFVAYASEVRDIAGWTTLGGRDPRVWALDILGLDATDAEHRVIQHRFRELLRDAHPDHGGESTGAAERITELTEARRILLAR